MEVLLEARGLKSNILSENWRGKVLFLLTNRGIGDAVISTGAAKRVKRYLPEADLSIGVWSSSQGEILQSLGFNTVKLPQVSGLRRIKYSPRKWPEAVFNLLNFSYVMNNLISNNDTVIYPPFPEAAFYILEAFKWLSPVNKNKFLAAKSKNSGKIFSQYVGFSLQEDVDGLFQAGQKEPYLSPEVGITGKHQEIAELMWKETSLKDQESVILNIKTGSPYKDIPFSQIEDLIKSVLNQKQGVVIVNYSSKDEQRLQEKFRQEKIAFAKNESVLNMGAFIKRAKLYIGGDTGLTHLAAALDVPTYAIFGPTSPIRWSNPDQKNVSVFFVEVPCRTRECEGVFYCGQQKSYCLEAVNIPQLTQAMSAI